MLAEYFGDLSLIKKYDPAFIRSKGVSLGSIANVLIPPDNNLEINMPFTLSELNFALHQGKGKLSGPDDIGYPILKNLSDRCKRHLLILLNRGGRVLLVHQ